MSATRWAVLDVETHLSDEAMLLLPAGPRPTIERVALQELAAAALLTFDEEAGRFSGFRLRSWSGDEAELLSGLSTALREVHDAGGRLATFNGGHDMAALRRRSHRHWLFGEFDLPAWWAAGRDRHDDLMLLHQFGDRRRPSLADACAGLGVPPAAEPASSRDAVTLPELRKCQLDVVLTAVLLFHHLAADDGTPLRLMRGWCSMAAELRPLCVGYRHLDRVLRHPSVAEGRAFLEAKDAILTGAASRR